MNTLKQMGLGALVSLALIAIIIFLQGMNLSAHMKTIIVGVYGLTLLLWGLALVMRRKISSMNKMDLDGDLEDELDVKKYRTFSDMSLSLQISSTLAIIGMCMALMVDFEMILVLVGIVMVFGSFILSTWMFNILQTMYPERNLPKITEAKYEEKLLATSDEGEKYVMLQGLYKSYNLVNALLIFGIIATAIYSAITEQSQLFSIFVMGIVIIAVNSRYMFAIRNK